MADTKSARWQALADLFGRYHETWRQAWRLRRETEAPVRLPHEAEFLPAALSLQETPVSPAPRVAMWLIIGFMLLTLLWSIFGRVDVVASAGGTIIPSGRSKTIQPLEAATVLAIHVQDGQQVKAGDVLLELDATTALADRDRLRGERDAMTLQAARGRAMLDMLDARPQAGLSIPDGIDPEQVQQARQLLRGQQDEYRTRAARIAADAARQRAELASTRALVVKLEQTVPIAQRRARDFQDLVARNFASRHAYLEREQVRIEQEGDLANQRSRIDEIEAALRATQEQSRALAAETRRVSLDSMTEAQRRAAELEQELRKADLRQALTLLRSPVDGTVQQLAVHTVGGVVTPAQALMLVVPREQVLEAETFLDNKDIGFVREGHVAQVKVETFQYTKYGTIGAKVASVSHDAINDEKRGPIYAVRLQLDQDYLDIDGARVRLGPGMTVTAEIKTGKRRVIEYFLSPLIMHTSESLRER